MRLVFAGTPAFSVAALQALHAAGHEIVGVYTQPDRPAGRGQKLASSAVSASAGQLGLPVFKPEKLRGNEKALEQLRSLAPELMVVVAYGLILPQAVLDIPPRGCLNIHASLLPRWRGAAPIQRAVLAGDAETGVTIMRMEAGLDTGPMLLCDRLPITADTTAGDLQDALATMGARLIVEAIAQLDVLSEVVQPADGVTYAHKLNKEEARLDWSLEAAELVRRIHGYNPMPGAWTELGSERIKLLRARVIAPPTPPLTDAGRFLHLDARGLSVGTGEGLLQITELQRPGGRATTPWQAFRGMLPAPGRFG